ncbi:MAG: calcium-translocating P-type ATPase, PMCA-type [Bacteroidaceae bacterium]|nr:calcium-translocating P-type ATPase, PMCA-type [Bacteroidaceae bacterium]
MDSKNIYITNCLSEDSETVINGKGQNIIPPPEKEPLWKGFISKFKDPLIIVLLVVFIFSVGVSIYEILNLGKGYEVLLEPMGVLIAMFLATGVGFVFEVKADKEFDILNKVKDTRPVKVLRKIKHNDGSVSVEVKEIPKSDVVVGDVVRLESGDEVPADGNIIEAMHLTVDESIFTGEPYADKSVERQENSEAAYPSNFLLRGATVIEGNAVMKVSACGMNTEEGKGIAKVQEGSEVKTPLNQQLDRLGKMISVASFIIGVLIVVVRLIYFFYEITDLEDIINDQAKFVDAIEYILHSIMIAVTLIVVAVPEGLPMSITVSLAMSMRKMLKENNLVRKLHACETMGAATVICTDKTGTLTKNKMTVIEHLFFGDTPKELIAKSIAVNSTADITEEEDGSVRRIGNPTECALLMWIKNEGFDYKKLRAETVIKEQHPFSTMTKYMETISDDGHVFIKGASEILLDKCSNIAGGWTKEQIFEKLHSYQAKAMRTLGFAIDDTFIGIVGIADPIRDDVAEAIHICRDNAGVRVIIVTGDTPGTAKEIGRQIGLIKEGEEGSSITGSEFAALSDEEALRLLANKGEGCIKIISRARPENKARLVTLLQKNGEVVAVTGDGTNDAPALSKAQVGLSMGDGTARAKEASDITIIDNSFSSINKAILWGRSLYMNIRRFIIFQTTINVCACLIVLFGAFTGKESPLNVTQMLWVNLIMDTFAAMALSSLPADKNVLNDSPRNPKSNIINMKMGLTIVSFGLIFFAALCYCWLNFSHDLFFTIFVSIQFWNIFNARYYNTKASVIQDIVNIFTDRKTLRENTSISFVLIASVIIIGQILIVTFGGKMFEINRPLTFNEWVNILLYTSPILIVPDFYRFIINKINK